MMNRVLMGTSSRGCPRLKMCGLMRPQDIEVVNELRPDYAGFVLAAQSRRAVTEEALRQMKALLHPMVTAVGVFVGETPERVAALLNEGVLDMAQLHGQEDETYIRRLRALSDKPILQAFRVRSAADIEAAAASTADAVLLDAGAGCGKTFDWNLLRGFERPYFLAGGLGLHNVRQAVAQLSPFALDLSSGLETNGKKDAVKMAAFAATVRSLFTHHTLS